MGLIAALKTIDPEREGMIVLSEIEIKQIQSVLLTMLKDLDMFCRQNQISWGLAGGSMLGAIRHHGFIPWDDDVDIHMPRSEFIRFRDRVINDDVFQDNYELYCPGDKDYIYHFPRIYKKGTIFKEPQTTEKMPNSIFIDVFIMDNIPNNKFLRCIHGLQCDFFLAAISAMRIRECEHYLLTHTQSSNYVQKEIRKRVLASKFFSFRRMESWIKSGDRCFAKINDNTTKNVCDPSGSQHYFGEIYRREDICKFKRVPFEGTELPIPIGAEKILRQRYGDNYMKMPPENKREKHTLIELNTGVD